jgi:ribosomal protein S8
MEQMDLKLRLFGGESLMAEGYGNIKPLTVRQIVRYGYMDYMKSLNLLCVDKKDLLNDSGGIDEQELAEISSLDLIIAFGGEELESEFEKALAFFLGGETILDKEEVAVYVKLSDTEVRKVDGKNFDNIVEVLKWHNYINNFEDKKIDEAPMDERTRKFKERLKKLQKQRDEIKKKKSQEDEDSSDLDFYDIISSISSKSHSINELNVMDLTVYQVYSKFKRMEVIDQYDISIKSILAGAKDIKLKHWSSKTD